MKILVTSESVGKGHPDKICDQISDAILDECLKQDKYSRVACEVCAFNRLVVIGGEITTNAIFDPVKIAWKILENVGYNKTDFTVIPNINKQSTDISAMVDKNKKPGIDKNVGAGDQGISIGYATNETKNYMPLEIDLANELIKLTTKLLETKKIIGIKHDMKSQVTIAWNHNVPKIDTFLMSIQHEESLSLEKLRSEIINKVFIPTAKKYNLNTDFKTFVNHAGKFIIGGPIGDSGLTGRKIIVDQYGVSAHVGGGAFSGKDYTKVDRSGAYFARWVAKHIVASKLADECEIQIGWCIGESKPVSFNINTFNKNKISEDAILFAIKKVFGLTVYDIIKQLNLARPIYSKTSVGGHFGRDEKEFSWEKIDLKKIEQLIAEAKQFESKN